HDPVPPRLSHYGAVSGPSSTPSKRRPSQQGIPAAPHGHPAGSTSPHARSGCSSHTWPVPRQNGHAGRISDSPSTGKVQPNWSTMLLSGMSSPVCRERVYDAGGGGPITKRRPCRGASRVCPLPVTAADVLLSVRGFRL